ncbi:MAG: ABC transporter permease [Acidobacteriia bacterium]|nr:ABC transporter permease [Terriglobia bacterium]
MNVLFQDLRYGSRTLWKSPGFTAVAVLTLAVGIGANTAIFSFVDAILLKPLPYANPDRIVRVLEKRPDGGRNGISALNYLDWARQNTVFSYMAAQTGGAVSLSGVAEPVRLRGSRISPHYFDIFGIKPVLGRTFAADEDQLGKERVAVLSHKLWETQFGADPAIVGRKIILDGQPHEVIGVLAAGGAFDRAYAQIWLPLAFEPQNLTRDFHWLGSYALLKPGVTLQQARAQMDGIGAQIAAQYPASNKGWGVSVDRFADILVGSDLRRSVWIMMAAVGMVLLIGCANLANLMMGRAASREREVAVRASLGAGRWRLVQQFLTESVLLSFSGGVLGVGLGYAVMAILRLALPPFSLPREVNVTMDAPVLLFSLALSILTGILFGLAPALQAARPQLAATMKEGGRGSTTGGARRLVRSALVVAEVALAFMLLSGAGLLLRSFQRLMLVDAGFDITNVITAGLPVSNKKIPDSDRLNARYREIVAAVEALPGVRDAALTSVLPLEGWSYGMPFQIAGQPLVDVSHRPGCFFKMVSPSYFSTLGIKLRRGRALSDRDGKGAPPATVINETFAKRYFKQQDPIGQRILIQEIVPGKTQLGPEIPWQVVGVIADEKIGGLNDNDSAGVYVSNEQSPLYGMTLIVRTAMDPLTLDRALREAIHGIDKDQPLTDVRTLEQVRTESVASDRLQTRLLGIFAGAAMLLAAIGIYGVISYAVTQRTHEIGIRAALGASTGNLLRLVLSSGMLLAAIGLALGFAGSLAVTRLMSTLLFGVGARDPLTLAVTAVLLGTVALLACLIPARRAAQVDPVVALRYE